MLRAGMGLAVTAAIALGGTAAASAATSTPAAPSFPGPGCHPWDHEHWNLNGTNQITVPYAGKTYTYSVTFKQYGSCLGGSLTDPAANGGAGLTGPISGTVNRNDVTFSFSYGSTSTQGLRTYTGTIGKWGNVSGTWSDAGSDHASGTWTLTYKAHLACPWWFQWWNPHAACPVYPPHPHH